VWDTARMVCEICKFNDRADIAVNLMIFARGLFPLSPHARQPYSPLAGPLIPGSRPVQYASGVGSITTPDG
jgi:hypothetical protein